MKLIISLIFFVFSIQTNAYGSSTEKKFINKLKQVSQEKQKFLKDISEREDICLSKFFSGTCLEKLDIDYETGIRDFELKNQEILRERRTFRAKIRETKRQKKMNRRDKTNLQ